MKVGLDGFSLSRNDSGIEIYLQNLINGLVNRKIDLEMYALRREDIKRNDVNIRSSELPRQLSQFQKLKWELLDIKRLISPSVDIFHCPHFILPLGPMRTKKVVTILDLAFRRTPAYFDQKTRWYYKLFLSQSINKADALICISDDCLNDLRYYYPDAGKKAVRVHLGFRDFSTVAQDESIRRKMSIETEFVLMIGALHPRKNLRNAIKAFDQYNINRKSVLIVAGSNKEALQAELKAGPNVKFSGYVSENELSWLYHHARLLLYPSFYEGFGFPILEGMSAGIPVITSNVSSMPEVSGYPAEWLCDPSDVESIFNLMTNFTEGARRQEVVQYGFNNLKKFSWSKMVDETIQVYDKVLHSY